ncbi:hypothetical protein ES703_66666 [subsurface metagenome]
MVTVIVRFSATVSISVTFIETKHSSVLNSSSGERSISEIIVGLEFIMLKGKYAATIFPLGISVILTFR